jgi:aldehyde:ferredoxin oxidoreductase
MTAGGFAGNILFVDLTKGITKKSPLEMQMAEKYGGGLGLTIKLAYDRIVSRHDALSPENPIVIGAGPLVGTNLPASSRVYGVSKFPGSGTIGWCGGGGGIFGCFLKNAGYDHIVIEGKSPSPVYITIVNDDVEIRDASSIWGKGVEETCEVLWNQYGRPAGVIAIGQAGEHQVSFSMAYIDRHSSLGRGGFGAVIGSKNLKAILVKGSKGIRVARAKSYSALSQPLFKKIRDYPYLKEWQDLGLLKSLPIISKENYHEIKVRRIACVSCPIGDKDVVRVGGKGNNEEYRCSSSAVNLLTPLIYGFKDYKTAITCITILDEYGLDMFEFFGIMSYAKALQDAGILVAETAEEKIDLTSLHSMEMWAKKISFREGIGHVMAGGFREMFRHFGDDTKKYAPYTIKGMLPYVGPRGPLPWNLFGTMELGQAMDHRGPHVGASGSPTYFAKRELEAFMPNMRRMGIPEDAIVRIVTGMGTPTQDLRVGILLRYSHQWFSILGSLGICARAQINRFYNARLCAALYEAVTGITTGPDTLALRADRAWTLLRMANVKEGHTRRDDDLPDTWFEDPSFRNYITGQPLSRQEVAVMIDDYYNEQGWDVTTGIPGEKRLKELDLTDENKNVPQGSE